MYLHHLLEGYRVGVAARLAPVAAVRDELKHCTDPRTRGLLLGQLAVALAAERSLPRAPKTIASDIDRVAQGSARSNGVPQSV